jgi:hypothetical protein
MTPKSQFLLAVFHRIRNKPRQGLIRCSSGVAKICNDFVKFRLVRYEEELREYSAEIAEFHFQGQSRGSKAFQSS